MRGILINGYKFYFDAVAIVPLLWICKTTGGGDGDDDGDGDEDKGGGDGSSGCCENVAKNPMYRQREWNGIDGRWYFKHFKRSKS